MKDATQETKTQHGGDITQENRLSWFGTALADFSAKTGLADFSTPRERESTLNKTTSKHHDILREGSQYYKDFFLQKSP